MLVLGLRNTANFFDSADYNWGSKALREQLDWLRTNSQTAREIIEFVENSSVVINIVVANEAGVFATSNSRYRFNLPVIVWSPVLASSVNAANITGTHKSGAFKFDKRVETEFPPGITLIHELGHAKQFIEHPDWFPREGSGNSVIQGSISNADLEKDNLARHEHPVCQQLGIRQRLRYDDFLGLRTVPFG